MHVIKRYYILQDSNKLNIIHFATATGERSNNLYTSDAATLCFAVNMCIPDLPASQLNILRCNDSSVGVNSDPVRNKRCLDRILGFKDLVQLLQRPSPSLWEEEVEDGELNGAPDQEDEVRMPADLLQCDGPSIVVEKASGVDAKA